MSAAQARVRSLIQRDEEVYSGKHMKSSQCAVRVSQNPRVNLRLAVIACEGTV